MGWGRRASWVTPVRGALGKEQSALPRRRELLEYTLYCGVRKFGLSVLYPIGIRISPYLRKISESVSYLLNLPVGGKLGT